MLTDAPVKEPPSQSSSDPHATPAKLKPRRNPNRAQSIVGMQSIPALGTAAKAPVRKGSLGSALVAPELAVSTAVTPVADGPSTSALASDRANSMVGIKPFTVSQPSRLARLLGFNKQIGIRVEARNGGESKIKTKYLTNFNLLESTFLTVSIVVLLCGIMFKASELPEE